MQERTQLSLCASLALALLSIPAVVRADASVPVDQVVAKLQQQTQVPSFIPAIVPNLNQVYWVSYGTNVNSYSVDFYYSSDCAGAGNCTYGGISAERGDEFFVLDPHLAAFNPANVVEPVSLANDVQGH